MSADDLLAVDDGRLGGDALEPVLGDRAATVAGSTGAPRDDAEQAADRDEGDRAEAQLQRWQSQQNRAVAQRLVVARRAVAHSVAPQGRVDAGVQLRAAVLAVVLHPVASQRRRVRRSGKFKLINYYNHQNENSID